MSTATPLNLWFKTPSLENPAIRRGIAPSAFYYAISSPIFPNGLCGSPRSAKARTLSENQGDSQAALPLIPTRCPEGGAQSSTVFLPPHTHRLLE